VNLRKKESLSLKPESLIPRAHLDYEKQRDRSRLKAAISIKYDTTSDLIELTDPIAKERPVY